MLARAAETAWQYRTTQTFNVLRNLRSATLSAIQKPGFSSGELKNAHGIDFAALYLLMLSNIEKCGFRNCLLLFPKCLTFTLLSQYLF
jgi:hypothetical protein